MIITKYVLHTVITPVQFEVEKEEDECLLSTNAVNPPQLGRVIGVCDTAEEAEESQENLLW